MSRTLVWSQEALDDFDQAIAYLAARSPQAARRVAAAVHMTARSLAAQHTGRPGRIESTFEKVVQRTPYVIAYAMPAQSETLVILRMIHMARDWSQDRWPE